MGTDRKFWLSIGGYESVEILADTQVGVGGPKG
jgi:hypothetical protein